MPELKNLCAPVSPELFARVIEGRDKAGLTNGAYITKILTEYYNWKENGGTDMAQENGKTRTLAFQISADLFDRIKAHLENESRRLGYKVTQREFVIGLIESALAEAERESAENGSVTAEEPEQRSDTEPDGASGADAGENGGQSAEETEN